MKRYVGWVRRWYRCPEHGLHVTPWSAQVASEIEDGCWAALSVIIGERISKVVLPEGVAPIESVSKEKP